MSNKIVVATPTYNSVEYLKVFINSWEKFSPGVTLVVVVDGSTDGTKEFLDSCEYTNLIVKKFSGNRGQPAAYNECLQTAAGVPGASHVLMMNDDMVFSSGWEDKALEAIVEHDFSKAYISVNLAWPGPPGYSAVSYAAGGHLPDQFDIAKWDEFALKYTNSDEYLDSTEFGPGFPFILSVSNAMCRAFDDVYASGGCLDTDFLFSCWLEEFFIARLTKPLFFHFSGGSTDKQKMLGDWVEHGHTFEKKWGIPIEKAMHAIQGIRGIEKDELVILNEKNTLEPIK